MPSRGDLADATQRLKLRKRANTWASIRWYVIGGGAALVVAFALWLVWFSPLLVAKQVAVVGNNLLTQDEVVSAAQVPLGTPLARVDVEAIRQRVAGLGPVADVTVSRSWPSTLKIEVTERVAVYQVSLAGGYGWVDADGVIFHQATKETAGLLVANVTDQSARLLADVATVVSSLSDPLAERVTAIDASTPDQIELKLTKDATLIWGSADQSELKSQVATVLLDVDATVYDVSAPEAPITK